MLLWSRDYFYVNGPRWAPLMGALFGTAQGLLMGEQIQANFRFLFKATQGLETIFHIRVKTPKK